MLEKRYCLYSFFIPAPHWNERTNSTLFFPLLLLFSNSIFFVSLPCVSEWSHLFLCKELKSLMFWVVEGKGSESGFLVIFKFGRLWLIFSFLSLLSPILIRLPPWTMIIPTYTCLSNPTATTSKISFLVSQL